MKATPSQIINTAILRSRCDHIDCNLEEKLKKISESPPLEAIFQAIETLSKKEKISKDRAALQIVSTIKDLDHLWTQYILLEGSDRLKNQLGAEQSTD